MTDFSKDPVYNMAAMLRWPYLAAAPSTAAAAAAAFGSGAGPAAAADGTEAAVATATHALVRRALLARLQSDYRRVMLESQGPGIELSEHSAALQDLLISLQVVLSYGVRPKPLRWYDAARPTLWTLIEALQRLPERERVLVPEAVQSVQSVNDMMPGAPPADKGRAWLMKALMEKHLADALRAVTQNHAQLSEWYEDGAFILHDEWPVALGLLDGLQALDYAFFLKAGGTALTADLVQRYLARPTAENDDAW